MRLSLVLLACMLGACASRETTQIRPFTTDGCTLFPDGDWRACCVEHDRDYWCGGSASERRASDLRLRECIIDRGHPFVAGIAHAGVRVGGSPVIPSYWRWGYGWPYGLGYRAPLGACGQGVEAGHSLPDSPKRAR